MAGAVDQAAQNVSSGVSSATTSAMLNAGKSQPSGKTSILDLGATNAAKAFAAINDMLTHASILGNQGFAHIGHNSLGRLIPPIAKLSSKQTAPLKMMGEIPGRQV